MNTDQYSNSPSFDEIMDLLGETNFANSSVKSWLDLHEVMVSGLDAAALFQLMNVLALTPSQVADSFGIRETKLHIIAGRGGEVLDPQLADQLCRVAFLGALATSVFKDHVRAGEWLVEKQSELRGRTPLQLTRTLAGFQVAEDVLYRVATDL